MRHPDEILTDFDAGAAGKADVDMREVLWEVIDDVRHSFALAMECDERVDDATAYEIEVTVLDYVTNHYGDD